MGWFESQVEERRRADDAMLDRALRGLASAATGERGAGVAPGASSAVDVVDRVLAYYGVEGGAVPQGARSVGDVVRARLATTGVMSRPVRLTGAWWADATGAMLAFDGEGEPVALVPGRRGGYRRIDARGSVRVTRATAADLAEGALCFYRPPSPPWGSSRRA